MVPQLSPKKVTTLGLGINTYVKLHLLKLLWPKCHPYWKHNQENSAGTLELLTGVEPPYYILREGSRGTERLLYCSIVSADIPQQSQAHTLWKYSRSQSKPKNPAIFKFQDLKRQDKFICHFLSPSRTLALTLPPLKLLRV
ncbi:hypothetical protein P7K49_036675 [Saguinus oedipus]|uniref:Uncharacterized protein n=1 Tax=Saguinus oedipus TaxID=9490 RepID=A0ABQ9TLH3_SAGOE|nr:hypothetical protein P7K49_036675 [Saguinus oedipus]